MNARINLVLGLLLAGTLACALAAGLMTIPH
jgi:hypothetical protein